MSDSQNPHPDKPGSDNPGADKLDLHCRQQLSALMDGALSPDEARFLLRRLHHDEELSGCFDRWQLAGDLLRGQLCVAAPAGFGQRVSLAIAAQAASAPTRDDMPGAPAPRAAWLRWGGGALAASVAAVALFVARQQGPEPEAVEAPAAAAVPVLATTAEAPGAAPDTAVPAAPVTAAEAAIAVATAPALAMTTRRQPDNARRGSATRNQQAARRVADATELPRRVAAASAHPVSALPEPVAGANPFSAPAHARPWPRSVIATPVGGSFNASFPNAEGARTFYPFEPTLPAGVPATQPLEHESLLR